MILSTAEIEILKALEHHPYITDRHLKNLLPKMKEQVLEKLLNKHLAEKIEESQSRQIINKMTFRPNQEIEYKITRYGIEVMRENKV